MNFIVENWSAIVLVLVFIGGGICSVVRFLGLAPKERYAKIQGWLLQAVLLAERDYGSGTGKLKLSAVYDKFVEKFPWFAKVTSFEAFSGYVDDALVDAKDILAKNNAIASIVEGGEDK